jgi:protein-L-isoaspartate(D-aspartate) O-methyltransferase
VTPAHLLAAVLLFQIAGDPYARPRDLMVKQQIEVRGVKNAAVLAAMRETPRHRFVPPGLENRAYDDSPLSIGYGQTISQPYIVARMTELLDPAPDHTVLEIGTGSGYQAAILARLAKHVYTIELVPELARRSQDLLRRLGYANITVRQGDGYQGWPEHAPFDRIILTAAPPEIPQALIDQLKRGGRLVAPVGSGDRQKLVVLEKGASGAVRRRTVLPVRFVPMVPGK